MAKAELTQPYTYQANPSQVLASHQPHQNLSNYHHIPTNYLQNDPYGWSEEDDRSSHDLLHPPVPYDRDVGECGNQPGQQQSTSHRHTAPRDPTDDVDYWSRPDVRGPQNLPSAAHTRSHVNHNRVCDPFSHHCLAVHLLTSLE